MGRHAGFVPAFAQLLRGKQRRGYKVFILASAESQSDRRVESDARCWWLVQFDDFGGGMEVLEDGVLEGCASEVITPLPHNSMSFSVWIFADRGVGLKRGEKPFTQGDGIRVAG